MINSDSVCWTELYSERVDRLEEKLTEELSRRFDQEATAEIKIKYPGVQFPIALKKKNIPFGKALLFDAPSYLHAGGPGKNE